MLVRFKATYARFPKTFWLLIGSLFIDSTGGALLYPYLSLYLTQRFGIGMTQVGIIFLIFSLSGLLGSFVSGSLTDRRGRKLTLLIGLVASALTALGLGLLSDLRWIYPASVVVGLMSNFGGPAYQAIIADVVDEADRTEAYGILRVMANLAYVIGPAVGGFLAGVSFIWIFATDAVASTITAVLVAVLLPETKGLAQAQASRRQEPLPLAGGGYRQIFQDRVFLAFTLLLTLVWIVATQLETSLPVFMRDARGFPPQVFGLLLSINGAMVVVLQMSISRWTARQAPFNALLLGALLYGLGFGLVGFVESYPMLILAIAITTMGEIVVSPVAQALVARLAPPEMRGRYGAVFQLSGLAASAVGPLAAGAVMDHFPPVWVWIGCALLATIAALGFGTLQLKTRLAPEQGQALPASPEGLL